MADRMKGKVVLVTGAGSSGEGWGNGKAAAVLYAREGARIFAVDRRIQAAQETQAIIRGEGGECEAHAAWVDCTFPLAIAKPSMPFSVQPAAPVCSPLQLTLCLLCLSPQPPELRLTALNLSSQV